MQPPTDILERTLEEWLADPDSDVVHVELVDGLWAMRMRQTVRDASTVWWEVGERSIRSETYVLPAPPLGRAGSVFRVCLVRNLEAWRAHFAIDREGAIVLRSRIGSGEANREALDLMLGEIYWLVESTFPLLVRTAFGGREKKP